MGREAFVERVWEWRRHYGGAILGQMKRLGASVDWNREYFTMDERLSVAVREAFVRLHEQGLIYRGALHRELVPALPDRHQRPRSGARRAQGPPLGDSLPGARRRRPRDWRIFDDCDDAAGDDARRRGGGHSSRRRALPASARQEAAAAADEPRDPDHARRLGQPRLRHRRGQGDPGARPQRLRAGRAASSCPRST